MDEKCRSEFKEKILDKIKCIVDNSDQEEQKLKFFEEMAGIDLKDLARYVNEKANYNVIDMSDKEDD